LPNFVASQNYVYVGTKQYEALEGWNFERLSVVFAKSSSTSGIMLISKSENQFYTERFGLDLIIYLKNGKQIILTPRISTDRVDGYFLAAYTVSNLNLVQLKNSDIHRIRYSVINEFGKVDNYTALNETSEYKRIKMPVPEAEHMSEMEKMQNNIESETLGYYDPTDPFVRPTRYYYRYETIKVANYSIETSKLISSFY